MARDPLRHRTGSRCAVVVAGKSTAIVRENIRGLRAVLLIAGVVTAVASWLVARLVAKRALAPLKRLAETAGSIASTGDIGARLAPSESDDEVGNLINSFNRMLDRLDRQQQQLADALATQRRFAADATHELRNPLATIRANLSFLDSHPEAAPPDRAAALADSNRAARRMTDLIDDLLRLARLDAGFEPPTTDVSMRAAAEDAIGRVHEPVEIRVSTDGMVRANADDLARLITNLLDNAIRHGAPPISVDIDRLGGEVRLRVTDRGPGIPPDQLEAIFERFHRLDPTRSPDGGTGLGLAIARALAERYGGSLVAGNGPEAGAVLTLTLPAT